MDTTRFLKNYFITGLVMLLCSLHMVGDGFARYAKEDRGVDSLNISIVAPQLKNAELRLISYFNGNTFLVDSIRLSDSGLGVFHKPQKLEEGQYLVYVDNFIFFEILLADRQSLQIQVDTVDRFVNNKVTGAKQSVAFAEYVSFITSKQRERVKLIQQGQALHTENQNTDEVRNKLLQLNQEVDAFRDVFLSIYKELWVGKFFIGTEPVIGPYPSPKTQEEATTEFLYQKAHFFDHIDFGDKRFWRTNFFPQKVIQYMESWVENIPDSLAMAATRLVEKSKGDTISFQLTLTKLMNYATQSDRMGMENVWAKLTEDHIINNKNIHIDSTYLANLTSEYAKIRFNRIGMIAQNILLQDSAYQKTTLYDMSAQESYTLVCFYEPNCGHCNTIVPQIYERLYKKYSNKGLHVACIYLLTDRDEWLNFVQERGLNGPSWTNLWDPDRSSYYWTYFDTSSTPAIYLLDKKKRIIAKKLSVESLDNLLEALMKP